MPKRASSWSFAKNANKCRKAAQDPVRIQESINFFRSDISTPGQLPQIYALAPRRGVGLPWLWNAVGFAELDPLLAFRYFHLVLRAEALANHVYLVRAHQLYTQWETQGATGKRPPVKRTGPIDLAELTMLSATAYSLHEEKMGAWFFQECLRVLSRPERYVEADAVSGGSVGPYLLRLYTLWRGQPESAQFRSQLLEADYGPYGAVFDNWSNHEALTEAVSSLADLHMYKAVNYADPNMDGVYCLAGWLDAFPAELLFLQLVRKELGLSVPTPSHPMLDSPFAKVPNADIASGYDEYLATSIASVRAAGMPDLDIPWERDFMALGPTDPRRLILTNA